MNKTPRKYFEPSGICKFYVSGSGRQSYVVDWYGNRASKDMPHSFACKIATQRNAKKA